MTYPTHQTRAARESAAQRYETAAQPTPQWLVTASWLFVAALVVWLAYDIGRVVGLVGVCP